MRGMLAGAPKTLVEGDPCHTGTETATSNLDSTQDGLKETTSSKCLPKEKLLARPSASQLFEGSNN